MKRLLRRNKNGLTLAVLVCLLTLPSVCQARQRKTTAQVNATQKQDARQLPLPVNLAEASTVQFSAAAPSAVEVGAKCDSEGNIYAAWSDSASAGFTTTTADEPIRKLAVKSKEIVTFRMPALDGYKRQFRWSFNLGPDGSLFILVRAQREDQATASSSPTYFLEKFKEDGSFD